MVESESHTDLANGFCIAFCIATVVGDGPTRIAEAGRCSERVTKSTLEASRVFMPEKEILQAFQFANLGKKVQVPALICILSQLRSFQ